MLTAEQRDLPTATLEYLCAEQIVNNTNQFTSATSRPWSINLPKGTEIQAFDKKYFVPGFNSYGAVFVAYEEVLIPIRLFSFSANEPYHLATAVTVGSRRNTHCQAHYYVFAEGNGLGYTDFRNNPVNVPEVGKALRAQFACCGIKATQDLENYFNMFENFSS